MGNMTGDYSTQAHDQLSPDGWKQARRLAERLTVESRLDAIYVSPLRRAIETVLPFIEKNGLTAEVWPELAEACWQSERRVPPHRTVLPRPVVIPDDLEDYFSVRCGQAFLPYKDEVYQEGVARISWVREELLRRHGGREESILAVGHAHAGSRLIDMLLGLAPAGWVRFDHANTGLTLLDQRGNGSFILKFANRFD